MDREKMIEEMANDIPAETKDPYQGSNLTVLYSFQKRRQIAKCLVSKNYCKVPEEAVVLTKDELAKRDEKVRKETAKEILQTLKALIKEPYQSYELCFDDLQRIAIKYGVEVE